MAALIFRVCLPPLVKSLWQHCQHVYIEIQPSWHWKLATKAFLLSIWHPNPILSILIFHICLIFSCSSHNTKSIWSTSKNLQYFKASMLFKSLKCRISIEMQARTCILIKSLVTRKQQEVTSYVLPIFKTTQKTFPFQTGGTNHVMHFHVWHVGLAMESLGLQPSLPLQFYYCSTHNVSLGLAPLCAVQAFLGRHPWFWYRQWNGVSIRM